MPVTRIWDADNGVWQLVGYPALMEVDPGSGYVAGTPLLFETPGAGSINLADYPGAIAFLFETQGAGGGSSGVAQPGSGLSAVGGAGGGGGYARRIVPVALLAAVTTFVVGAGGTAGASGNNAGGLGGNTYVNLPDTSTFGATGGGGGSPGAAFTPLTGVPGGPGSPGGGTGTVDWSIAGDPGWVGFALAATRVIASAGGGSFLAAARNRSLVGGTTPGSAGRPKGGGATGAVAVPADGAAAGAVGGDGCLIITPLYENKSGFGGGGVSGDYLPLVGGTLLGPLTLAGAPTNPLHAATKAYVDSFAGGGSFLPIGGGSLTGFLTLHADPTATMHAATKKYVDDNTPNASTTVRGLVQLSSSVSSTSTTLAATASAAKAAYDAGNHSHPYAPTSALLAHQGTGSQIHVSTAGPSGQQNGDVWLQVI